MKVEESQNFPADLLLISSSEQDGQCFIDTSNVDGKTNLKIRCGLQCTTNLKEAEGFNQFSCEIDFESPNENVNEFHGTLIIKNEKHTLGFFCYCTK